MVIDVPTQIFAERLIDGIRSLRHINRHVVLKSFLTDVMQERLKVGVFMPLRASDVFGRKLVYSAQINAGSSCP